MATERSPSSTPTRPGSAAVDERARHASDRWPEIAAMAAAINAGSVVLDGEMCVLDDDGKPRFELIQRSDRPAVFHAFDVLEIDGHDLTSLPYENRRTLLEGVLEPGPNWIVPAHRIGGGAALLAATAAAGLEGVMAKRLGSTYRPGARSDDWRKIKNRQRVEVTIGGFSAGTGARAATFGALLVGIDAHDGLAFAGGVGTGFTDVTLRSLRNRFESMIVDEPPFTTAVPAAYRRGATWVRPELRAVLEIAEITNEGYVRHASFVGLVDD
ncbi:MAG: RNA ligase family protein [Acidimicrobiales bacterium]